MDTNKYDSQNIRTCVHCGTRYDWRSSTAEFKMTYCWMFCQLKHEGISIDSIMHWQPSKPFKLDPLAVQMTIDEAAKQAEEAALNRLLAAIREG